MERECPGREADAAFAGFLQASRAPALAFLRRLGCGEAEDVLHDAFGKAWRHRETFDPAQPSRTQRAWLLRIAFRAHVDWWTRTRRAVQSDDAAVRRATFTRACAVELRDELAAGLARLSAVERALLLAFHQGGRSIAELARAHGLPPNTVKSHLHRARRKLAAGSDGGPR